MRAAQADVVNGVGDLSGSQAQRECGVSDLALLEPVDHGPFVQTKAAGVRGSCFHPFEQANGEVQSVDAIR